MTHDVTIQRLSPDDLATLSSLRITSLQLVWPENAPESCLTITRVTMAPGAISARHAHPHSEQVWLIEKGSAILLLSGDKAETMHAGDVIRTPAGIIHGVTNTGMEPFVYLAITTPPQNFAGAYDMRSKELKA